MTERYHVQRATTGAWLSRDAQITLLDRTKPLSAVGTATFVCEPDVGEMKAADGYPMFDMWRTLIAVEEDGDQIPWRGIVTDSGWEGKTWTITVDSIATYPHGIAWDGLYLGAEVAPADIVRTIWKNVQDHTDGDLGVKVVGSTSLRVGSYSTQNKSDTLAAYNAAHKAWKDGVAERVRRRAAESAARDVLTTRSAAVTAASKALTAARKTKDKAKIAAAAAALDSAEDARDTQKAEVDRLGKLTDQQAAEVDRLNDENSRTYKAKVAASKAEKSDGGAIALNWWEAPDCGQTIDTLASDWGFDWVERHVWTDDQKSDIRTEIVVVYPRMGRRRDDLYFEQGVNIRTELHPTADADSFAQTGVGIGAGEGAGSIRRSAGRRDGRLRRTAIVTAKDAKTTRVLDARLAAAISTHQDVIEITSVSVVDHPNARIGSWQTGDDILLRGVLPHLGEVGLWHRITEWKSTSPTTAELTVKRSSSFTYGG